MVVKIGQEKLSLDKQKGLKGREERSYYFKKRKRGYRSQAEWAGDDINKQERG